MRVVIAEDSVLLRDGLARLLTAYGMVVADAVGDGEQLLVAVERERPDLIVVDVRMPPSFSDEGLRAALEIRASRPEVAVVVLSQYVEERYATELLSRPDGRVGYLLKDRVADVDEFVETLRRVRDGATALDPEVVAQLLVRHRGAPLERLTPRETQVLKLMAEGRSNSGIAAGLVITTSAVAKHVNSIFTKLGIGLVDNDHRRVLAVLQYLQNS
ncbi:response regulator [Dactylosporangium sp. NPDC051541]|uniref:response regulator transcription factor n=1 Tax=Dactylosporangium sp. NPDC051541 TaxID=3363977 RepID=UPI0037B5D27D